MGRDGKCVGSKMGKSTEIRGGTKAKVIGRVIGGVIWLVGITLRMRFVDRTGAGKTQGTPDEVPPMLYSLWHNRVFIMPFFKRKFLRKRRVTVLTSASKDGTILETAVGMFGMGAVRGSSSRRAVAALVAMKKALKAGSDVCVTPDGPRGPVYKIQAGIVKLAQTTGAPLCIVRVHYSSYWSLKSWDRFMIPKPFSKVEIIFEEPYFVGDDLDEAGFEAEREKLEQAMSLSA
ncbi:hypothetical protein SAMN02745181_2910 [Rubritalea squalenifaciens DSM 18772]|uniref:DUF374 domain-containing protein n=2 Tax=Rubritalea squalenifaciens TaxID=407226 RepID=A0A1M6NN86_9BACT|nr:hypothetical protein SAMN02745181_2910 [Rubritalea squalenifaciens DSM 18772]